MRKRKEKTIQKRKKLTSSDTRKSGEKHNVKNKSAVYSTPYHTMKTVALRFFT